MKRVYTACPHASIKPSAPKLLHGGVEASLDSSAFQESAVPPSPKRASTTALQRAARPIRRSRRNDHSSHLPAWSRQCPGGHSRGKAARPSKSRSDCPPSRSSRGRSTAAASNITRTSGSSCPRAQARRRLANSSTNGWPTASAFSSGGGSSSAGLGDCAPQSRAARPGSGVGHRDGELLLRDRGQPVTIRPPSRSAACVVLSLGARGPEGDKHAGLIGRVVSAAGAVRFTGDLHSVEDAPLPFGLRSYSRARAPSRTGAGGQHRELLQRLADQRQIGDGHDDAPDHAPVDASTGFTSPLALQMMGWLATTTMAATVAAMVASRLESTTQATAPVSSDPCVRTLTGLRASSPPALCVRSSPCWAGQDKPAYHRAAGRQPG